MNVNLAASARPNADNDPITLQIIRHELIAIPNQIERNIERTAFSPLVQEYKDYSVGFVDPDGTIDQMAHLRGDARLFDERTGHVLEHADEVDFLLVMAANSRARLLPHNGQNRHVIEARVVKPSDQVRGARSRRLNADAKFAGEFRVRRGHEGGHLLVPDLDKADLVFTEAIQRAQQAVDAVTWVAIDATDTPLIKPVPEEISDSLGHVLSPHPAMRKEHRRGQRGSHANFYSCAQLSRWPIIHVSPALTSPKGALLSRLR